MPGTITWKERAIVTLTSTGASLTNASASVAGTDLDVRAAGNFADDFAATFTLQAQCATITGIVKDTIIAELYLVPAIDGTNFPDIDLTAGASAIPFTMRAGVFIASKAMVAATNMLFQSNRVNLLPLLYRPYIINRCGQTITANWALKAVGVQGQYT